MQSANLLRILEQSNILFQLQCILCFASGFRCLFLDLCIISSLFRIQDFLQLQLLLELTSIRWLMISHRGMMSAGSISVLLALPIFLWRQPFGYRSFSFVVL